MQREFTEVLYELFVRQNLSLSHSLLIMSRKPKKDRVKLAAEAIYSALERGSVFSSALKICDEVRFDDVYISFILLAEKNGDLKSTVSYLKEKLTRENEQSKKLIGASIYPAFVIVLAVASSVFIGLYTDTADFSLLAKYVGVFLLLCVCVYFVIFKMLGNDRLCEAFTAVDFLLRNGIELSEAVGCAVQIAGPSGSIGKIFENARIKLSYGMDLQTAFDCKDNRQFSEIFYYADTGGSQLDLFSRIAAALSAKNERRRTICLSLVEPVFIVMTGGFILMILMTFFMPLINDISWI